MSNLVSRKAPDFTAAAVLADGEIVYDFNLYNYIKDKYAIIFFYPMDFTFVCPSEIIALNHRMGQFLDRKAKVIAISIDSQFTHNAWRNTPVDKGGIGKVLFPLVADVEHKICQAFAIEHPDAGVAMRATFVIDREGKVRSQMVNDLPIGRNIDEILRILDALEFHEEHGDVCPAGWNKGEPGMKPTPEGVALYLAEHEDKL